MSIRNFILIFFILFANNGCLRAELQDKAREQKSLTPANVMQNTINQGPMNEDKLQAPEVLVKFKSDASQDAIENLAKNYQLEMIKVVSRPNLYLFKIVGDQSVNDVVKALNSLDIVEYSEPNYTYKLLK